MLTGGLLATEPGADPRGIALLLDIDGAIGPPATHYVEQGIEEAAMRGAEIVILRMDTPGGLDTSMREIIKNIIASPVPVASYVAPSGARAASAGTYILYASHIAAMAPGTNLGAATPVQLGGGPAGEPTQPEQPASEDGGEDAAGESADDSETPKRHPDIGDKALNDAIAYIRGLAQLRGRNEEWAEKAVSEAASLPANDALAENVIDLVARDVDALLAAIDGREVEVAGGTHTLETADLEVVAFEPDWQTRILTVITDPNIAYILLMIGTYGLLLEFYSPGAIVPGVVGAICLLIGLYALHILPINYAGLGLIALGIALMVAEIFAPSFGALGIGGIVALVVGSVMLIETDVPGFGISPWLIGSVSIVGGGSLLLVAGLILKSRRRAAVSGAAHMEGKRASVLNWSRGEGRVRVHGEIWHARGPDRLRRGDRVRVTGLDGLTLIVEPEPQERS
jgi:membrane-bound serine protease (ClpP class)